MFVPTPAEPTAKAKILAVAPKLDALIQGQFSASGATASAIGIVLDGELIYERYAGVLARGSTAAVSGDSIFRVASLSKSFTALAVLQLRDAGQLSLDAPVADYLPELRELRGPTQDSAPITARLLLSHGSGLPWDDTWGAVSFGFSEHDLHVLLKTGVSLAREPDSAWEYSNLGFALLGQLIARRSGMSFEAYMTQQILRPLGMTSTAWHAGAVAKERMAIGYWGDHEPLSEAARAGDGVFEPAGGMYTSLHDYARYLAFQLAAYPPRDAPERGPVRRSSVRETHRAQRLLSASSEPIAQRTDDGVSLQERSYGFGWMNVTSCDHRERLDHNGWEPGYFAGVTMFPMQHIAVVTMATTKPLRLAEKILKLLSDANALPLVPEPEPSVGLLSARQSLISLLNHWDESIAQHTFDARSARYPWYARMQEAFFKLAREHGACTPDGPLRATNRLGGSWNMRCERGTVELAIDLTPSATPAIDLVRWTEMLPPDERMTELAARLTAAINDPAQLPAELPDAERTRKRFAHAAIDDGACAIDRAIAGDGRSKSTFALTCTSGRLELAIELDDTTGKVVSLDLYRPHQPGAACWQ